jgi:hypothetical protein
LAGVAIFFPLFNYAPKLYLWFMRERMSKIYRRLRFIEKALQTELAGPQLETLQSDLPNVDKVASSLWVPVRHSGLFFSLKVHIDLMQTRLASRLDEVRSKTASTQKEISIRRKSVSGTAQKSLELKASALQTQCPLGDGDKSAQCPLWPQ